MADDLRDLMAKFRKLSGKSATQIAEQLSASIAARMIERADGVDVLASMSRDDVAGIARHLERYTRSFLLAAASPSPCVYVIQAGDDGPVKIGYSTNPETRIEALQSANHEELVMVAAFEAGRDFERKLHTRFEDRRIRREWFEASVMDEILAMQAQGAEP